MIYRLFLKLVFIIIIILLLFNMNCSLFSGLLYPKIVYNFYSSENIPYEADDRFELAEKFQEPIIFYFSQSLNNFKVNLIPIFFLKKKSKVLDINEMLFEWPNGSRIFIKNKKYIKNKKMFRF